MRKMVGGAKDGTPSVRSVSIIVVWLLTATVVEMHGQDEPEAGWFYNAELSLLFTGGNSDSQTFGVRGGIRRVWEHTEWSLNAGGLRTETGVKTRTAVGTVDSFTLDEATVSATTAENYFVASRLDRSLSDAIFAYLGAGWERNTFAGFDDRFTIVGGLGNTWVNNESTRLKTDYGVTFTSQNDVVDDPGTSRTFGGIRGSAAFWRRLTSSSSFESGLIVDENLSETEDLRADWTSSLVVDINAALALKTSLRLLWDNLPALTGVPLERPLGTPTGETVLVPLNELDTVLTIALVANF